MNKIFTFAMLLLSLLMSACSSTESDESVTPIVAAFSPQFSPKVGLIPFPNDLYFAGSTDGTLNIPELSSIPVVSALNALDGFSTNASIKVRFNSAVDANSLIGGATAHIFEVVSDPATKATIGFIGALVPGVDYTVGVSTATDGAAIVEFTPISPLNPKSTYLLALTSGIMSTAGVTATPDTTYQTMKDALANGTTLSDSTLDLIKQLIGAHLGILNAVGIQADNVLVSASFSTQSTTDVLEAAASTAIPQFSQIQQVFAAPGVPLNTNMVNPALPGYADVYAGIVQTPYYLSTTDPLNTPWQGMGGSHLTRYNPLPVATETVSIPALVTIPNSNSPWYQAFEMQFGMTPQQAGYQWPLVIFQHGVTRVRTDAFAIVDAYASAGFAVISIDQPLHGITDTTNPFYLAGFERTFDLDLDGNNVIDPSGSYSNDLSKPLVGRDNSRQGAYDIHQLAKTAPSIDITGDGIPDFDGSQMHFLGQSFGAMVGTAFLGINNDVITGTLSVGGGGIANLLRESISYGPLIEAGLIAAGLTPGTSLYDDYFRNAQTVADSSDPLSYAALASANHPILFHKVIGDTTVPNNSTDRLISALGLPAANQLGVNAGPLGAVTFIAGSHSSLLSPSASFAATQEMQIQAVVFAAGNPMAMIPGNGQAILIQDGSVVELAAP